MISHFWVTGQFSEKCTECPQITLTFSRSKIPTCVLHTHPRPGFCPFHSRIRRFWVMEQILERCTKCPPKDLGMFEVQNTNMRVTYTSVAQIFVCFALRWSVFELQPNFRKSAPNDPKGPWHVRSPKYQHACYIHPPGPNFRMLLATISRF